MSQPKNRTLGTWPIVRWESNGAVGFRVEDDQGYNFSFPTKVEAETYRADCFFFVEEMAKREKVIVDRFREELFS